MTISVDWRSLVGPGHPAGTVTVCVGTGWCLGRLVECPVDVGLGHDGSGCCFDGGFDCGGCGDLNWSCWG